MAGREAVNKELPGEHRKPACCIEVPQTTAGGKRGMQGSGAPPSPPPGRLLAYFSGLCVGFCLEDIKETLKTSILDDKNCFLL